MRDHLESPAYEWEKPLRANGIDSACEAATPWLPTVTEWDDEEDEEVPVRLSVVGVIVLNTDTGEAALVTNLDSLASDTMARDVLDDVSADLTTIAENIATMQGKPS